MRTSLSFLLAGVFTLTFMLAGCDSEAMQSNDPDGQLPSGNELLQIGGFVQGELESDPFVLKTARFNGTEMEIDVAYSGGCAEHGWRLFADEAVTLSMPPQLSVYMTHDDAGDLCDAFPSESIQVDASALVEWFNSPFILHLHGVNSDSDSVTVEWGIE